MVNNQIRASEFFSSKFAGNTGDCPNAHWCNFKDYCFHQNLQLNNLVNRFKTSLSGQARLWIEGKVFANLNDMKQQFLSNFSGMLTQEGTTKMFRKITYIKGETIEKYLTKIKLIANQLNYNDDLVKDQFITGLPENIAIAASMSGAQNLNQLVPAAQRYQDMTEQKEVRFSLTAMNNLSIHESVEDQARSDSRSDGYNRSKYDSQAKHRQYSRDRYDNRNPNRDRYDNRDLSRDRYDNRNHGRDRYYHRDRTRSSSRGRQSYRSSRGRSPTPNRQTNNRQRTTDRNCDYCGIKGHLWRQCRKLQGDIRDGKVKQEQGQDL